MTDSLKPTETAFLRKESLEQRILFCTDFSENANFAFIFAVDAAIRRPGSQLYLLHVVPESEAQFWKSYIYEVEGVDAKAMHDINERIDQTYRSRLPENLELKVEFRIGKDYQEILNFTRENQIDLIIAGSRGLSQMRSWLLGSVSSKLTHYAKCSILIVRMPEEG